MTHIRFHIGAHKTATTHLQMTLAGCRFKAGTRYVPLRRLRRWLTSRVRKGPVVVPWHRWYSGTWLFSDENILGTTAQALKMYPDPARALKYFADCDLTIFLCVRAYETFLPSAWGERLWHHPVQAFDTSLPERRWPDVVSDLKAALPDSELHLWRYEDYREHAQAITRDYAGDAIASFPPPLRTRPKSGFSQAAADRIQERVGERIGRRRLEALRDQYPIGPDSGRFDPYTESRKRELADLYETDLEALRGIAKVWTP